MPAFRSFLLLLLMLFSLGVSSQTNVSGNINGTWDIAGSPYNLVGDVTVLTNDTLTIEAGVEIFMQTTNNDIIINGTLIANGDQMDTIKFAGPEGSNGGYIRFTHTNSNSQLSYCDFARISSSSNSYPAALNLDVNTAASISDCTFSENYRDIQGDLSSISNMDTNDLSFIHILPYSSSSNDSVPKLGDTTAYYVLGDLNINSADTLTIAAGAKFFLPSTSYDVNVNGTLMANGTLQDTIMFYGAEGSNGGFVRFTNTSSDSHINYCDFTRMSSSSNSYPAALNLDINTAPVISNCSFSENFRDIQGSLSSISNIGTNDVAYIYVNPYSSTSNNMVPKPGDTTALWLLGTLTINSSDTLTLAPGLEVFIPSSSYNINVNGTLVANGTALDTIKFFGEEGSNSGYIRFTNTNSDSQLSYCDFKRISSSSSSYSAALNLNVNTAPFVTNCSFSENYRNIQADLSSISNIGANDIPYIHVYPYSSSGSINIPKPGDTTSLWMLGTITINSADTITLTPGLEIYLASTSYNVNVSGTLLANGTAQDTIKFLGPEGSNSGYIRFSNTNSNSQLSYCDFTRISSSSNSYPAAINLDVNTAPSISNCTFSENYRDIQSDLSSISNIGANDIPYIHIAAYSSTSNTLVPNPGDSTALWMLGTITINAQDTLELTPGLEIYLSSSSYNINVSGTLLANGTTQDSIKFYGPEGSNGGYIRLINSSSDSQFSYCDFTRISSSSSFYPASLYLEPNTAAHISNCTFSEYYREINADFSAISNIGLNDIAYIYIRAYSSTSSFEVPEVGDTTAYQMLGDITINSADTLTLAPGVKLYLPTTSRDIHVIGTLIANGTAQDSIYVYGPENSNSGYIRFTNTSSDSQLKYCDFTRISSSSHSYRAALNLENNTATSISECTFSDNYRDINAYASSIQNIVNQDSTDLYLLSVNINAYSEINKIGNASKIILDGDITVGVGDTLKINPGVDLYFDDNTDDIRVNGTLLANGTLQDSIGFLGRSLNGGNPFGGRIDLNAGSFCSMSYVRLDSIGDGTSSSDYSILANSQNFQISNSKISNAKSIGIHTINGIDPIIQECTFENNPKDINIHPESGANITDNTNADIYIYAGTIDEYSELKNPGTNSRYIMDGDITIGAGDTLKMNPGVTLYFNDNIDDIRVNGTLLAEGSAQDSIKFLGRNFNGGNPYGGRIDLNASSFCSMSYVLIDSLGDGTSSSDYSILAQSPNFQITNSKISNAKSVGIYTINGVDPVIQSNTFESNPIDINIHPESGANITDNVNANIFIYTGTINQHSEMKDPGASSRYIVNGDINIGAGDTLKIFPGVELYFDNNSHDLRVYGTLLANGNIQDSIKFLGRDIITSSPYGGRIDLNPGSFTSISYAVIDSLGDGSSSSDFAFFVQSSDFEIANSSISNSKSAGIYTINDVVPKISDCTFSNNPKDINIHPESGSFISDNLNADIYIYNGNIDTYSEYNDPGINSKYILEGDVSVGASDTLKINPGVDIYFDIASDDLLVYGTLIALGTEQDSIRFIGGNPSGGNTYGGRIDLYIGSKTEISYAVIDSMGDGSSSSDFAIYAQSQDCQISNSKIVNSKSIGIYTIDGVDPMIEYCSFDNNPKDINIHPESGANIANNVNADVYIYTGNIDQYSEYNVPGTNSNYIIDGDITIQVGDSLKISPGVEIIFDDAADDIKVYGTLLASGTEQDRIKFLGRNLGGTNIYGGGLEFFSSSTNSTLINADIDSLGNATGSNTSIFAASPSFTMSGCSLTNSKERGIAVSAQNISPIISNNYFANNGKDIQGYLSSCDSIHSNTNCEIYLYGENITSNNSIPHPGTDSYYILEGGININSGYLLNISPGVLFDFTSSSINLDIYGTLQAVGTELAPIQFVRIQDGASTYGGRVRIFDTGSNSILSNINVDHLGASSYALYVDNSSTTINNLRVLNSNSSGLYLINGDYNLINCTLAGCATGLYVGNGFPTLINSSIYGNLSYGINNVGQDTVDARDCWWGDVSGPFHSTNPTGLGNQVSDKVLFLPVSDEPPSNSVVNGQIISLLSPVSDCELSDSSNVVLSLANLGNITQSNFDLGIIINEQDTVMENVGSINLLPGQTLQYEFDSLIDLSTIGEYTIESFISIQGDSLNENDTILTVVSHYDSISAPAFLFPLNNTSDLEPNINFSWSPSDLNPTYNFYLWESSEAEPSQPTFSNLTQISIGVGSTYLQYGTSYKWKVEAYSGNCVKSSNIQEFTIKDYADIIVQSIQTPAIAFSGQNVLASWEIKNIGNGSTGSNIWYDAVYLSTDSIYGGSDIFLGNKVSIASLMSNESYSNDLSFNLPEGIQGTYYIIVRSDVYNSIVEFDNGNNIGYESIPVTLTPPPDLKVSSVITPNNAFSEQFIDVTWTVTNDGSGATESTSWYDRLYLSTDPTFNINNATSLKYVQHNDSESLQPDSSYTETSSIELPQGIFGDYYVHVVTDVTNQVYEYAFEDNNFNSSNVINVFLTPPPDLIVTGITVVDSVNLNEDIVVEWTVENQGANPVKDVWFDRVFVSSLDTFNISYATSLGSIYYLDSLNSGASISSVLEVTLPDLPSDSCFFYIRTDDFDYVYEYNFESNNVTKSQKVNIKKADLEITNMTLPDTLYSGEGFNIAYTIENAGIGDIITKFSNDRFYYSDVFPFDLGNATYLGSNNYPLTLSAGQSLNKQYALSIPNDRSGLTYFYIISDFSDAIIEGDENNNISSDSRDILVSPTPDLVVDSMSSLPDSIFAGTTIPFDYTILNQGDAPAQGSTWNDKTYVLVDSIWNEQDAVNLKKIDRLQSLEADSNYQVNTSLTLPMLSLMVAGLDSFSYVYIYVVTDANDNIYEEGANNLNNVLRSEKMHVTCPPPVDLNMVSVSSISDSLLTGEEVSITWMVQNIGSTTEYWEYPFWYDGFFLSTDTIFDNGDIFIEDFTIPGPLDGGGVYSETQSIQIPATSAGNYFLLMVADHQNRNNDGDLSNNVQVIPVTSSGSGGSSGPINITPVLYPDLKANTLNVPSTAVSGQPFEVVYSIQNIGDTTVTISWTDKIYLSNDFLIDNNDAIIGTNVLDFVLAPDEIHYDTLEVISPIDQIGNKIILFKTDANNSVTEAGGENNNTLSTSIFLSQALPADLVTISISPLDTIMVNEEIDIYYDVQNIGQNPANGFQKDIIYLSQDTVFDVSDYRVAIDQFTSNIGPSSIENRSSTMLTTPGVPIGDYYILTQIDAQNNINESNEGNNIGVSEHKVHVTVPILPIGSDIANNLPHENNLYYKIEIPDSLINETLRISLKGDSILGNNEIYLSFNEIPTRANHDFAFDFPFSGNQELIVPELESGTYYLLIYGQHETQAIQNITVRADIIDFFIQSIQANEGGNTGSVTTKIKGARFEEGMEIKLMNGANEEIIASNYFLISSTQMFVTFDLGDASTGLYDVIITKSDNSIAQKSNAFTVNEGDVGGFAGNTESGFFCNLENIDVENLLSSNVLAPVSVRINRVVPITIIFGNNGDIDIPCPSRLLLSLRGAPLALDPNDLVDMKQELFLEFGEIGGLPGILRPGAIGSVTVYTFSSHPLRFILTK